MIEILAPLVLELATSVLKQLVPILLRKLQQKLLAPTPEDTRPTVEIKDAEIIEKIQEKLRERGDVIRDDIKNDNEKMTHLIQQVLNEVKTLSKQNPDLQVASDEIILSEPEQEENKKFDSKELAERLERIEKSLDEIANRRRIEIEATLPSQYNNISQQPISKSSQSEEQVHKDENQGLPSGTNMEMPDPENPESKIMLENLHLYQDYGESVLRGLEDLWFQNQSLANNVLDNPQLQDCLERLKNAANKTIEFASSPVKIAIMGEFSSGKTQLVESLIGFSGILPVSANATTGNVTAIHLIPQEGFKTTQFDNFTVQYLSDQEFQECLDFMLEQAKLRAKAGLPGLPQANLKSLNDDILNSYQNWCEEAWKSTQNPELRYLLRELVIFIRAYVSYSADLCGKSFKIDSTTAREGLELAGIPPAIQSLSFQDIPQVPKLFLNRERISAEILQNSFSLIRRIDIDVKISKEIWNLSTTQSTTKFTLLDFPGLGAAESGVRDTFLSWREFAEVQTILILLNGKSPGSDRANKIFTMMEERRRGQNLKDLILVGVGRFNQLPLDSPGDKQKLDELIKSGSNNSLTEEIVFQKLPVLKTTADNASTFTSQQDRIVLLDQLMGLADLAKRFSGVEAGTTEFLANLEYDGFLEQSKRMREKWERLSEHLLKTDSRSTLGKQLGYFAQDGGIGKLRELIQSHVAEHGLKQLHEDTRGAANTLHQEQNNLKQILTELGISTVESQALIDLRGYLKTMYTTYIHFQDNLGKEPLKDRQKVAVSDVVKDEVTFKILNWKQWTLLFNKAKNGMIVLTKSTGAAGKLFGKRVNTDNIPTKSDDFYEVFDKTVKELEIFARDCIKEAVRSLLTKLSNEIAKEIEHFQGILHEDMETEIEENFDTEKADIFSTVYRGYNPKEWEESIMEEVFQEGMEIESAPVFPLARAEKHNESSQIFDWALERSQTTSKSTNHLLLVQRLRDEITASISLHLIEYVSKINKKVDLQILDILDTMVPALNELSREEALLRYLAGDKQESHEVNPIAPFLSQIALISFPDISSLGNG